MKTSRLMGYEWMVKHTPQEEWIEGKGVLLWLAFFFSEIGAGIYFVSIFLNFRPGWLVGWLVSLVLGGFIHLGFLGKPLRTWRILLRPASSEISRGMWVVLVFAVIGFFQVLPVVVSGVPWSGDSSALKVIMGILCILLITHGFSTMNVVRALPMWNSSMMLPLSLISGIWVGSQGTELMLLIGGHEITAAEVWARWSLLSYMGALLIFLWGCFHSSETTKRSVKGLLTGVFSAYFYVGVVAIGIIIPLIITLFVWGNEAATLSGSLLCLRFTCVIIGDLATRYSIMKGALYSPLI
ncbi:MAG: DMSO reductase [Deltaproteobacteria bacterium]|nr:MAG: DMSO reductase [Deltaproteobacteria bacterium]